MAGNNESITLNLQDFIPYPLKILHLSDLVGSETTTRSRSQSVGGSAKNTGTTNCRRNRSNSSSADIINKTQLESPSSGDECPFDCCQKNLQQIYFPDCELTNATIKMNIGSGIEDLLGGKGGGCGGVPCLERRTIYEGRVTDMPVKFEELLKESEAAQGEDIVVDRNNTSSLAVISDHIHSQQQQQISIPRNVQSVQHQMNIPSNNGSSSNTQLGKDSTLRLTFHQQQQNQHQMAYAKALAAAAAANANVSQTYVGHSGGGKDGRATGSRQQQQHPVVGINTNPNTNVIVGEDPYHYVWDSRKSGWTWTKGNLSSPECAAERYAVSQSSMIPYNQQQQQQHISSAITGRNASQQQFEGWNSQQLHQLQMQQQQHNHYGDADSRGGGGGGVMGNEYWDKRDVEHMHSLWLKQQQLHSQPQQRFRKPATINSITGTSSSNSLMEYSSLADHGGNMNMSNKRISDNLLHNNPNSLLNVDSNVDHQLNSYLKSYKYMKPSGVQQGYAGMHIGGSITRGSPMTNKTLNAPYPIGNTSTKAAQSTARFRNQHNIQLQHHQQDTSTTQLNLKRSISPRTALEQFERLEKYWNYQHQLLEAEDFTHHSAGDIHSGRQQATSAAAASYGGQTPAKLLRTGNSSGASASATSTSAYPSQHELDIRAYAGLGSASSSGGAMSTQSHVQSYGGTNSSQGASSTATWSTSGYGGKIPVNTCGSSTIQSANNSNSGTASSSGTSSSNNISGSGTQECNWAVSVIEILPQSFPPNKQSIAGSHQQGANTTLVSKERLLSLSRSAASATTASANCSSALLGASKTRDMCKAITSADVSNLYCTTINRVPARDLNLKTITTSEIVASVTALPPPTKVLDSFEYNKAVLIGPISNDEMMEDESILEMSGNNKSSAFELSKLAKNHERQIKVLESKQNKQRIVEIDATSILSNKKTSNNATNTPTTCEDNDVPRDLTIPRRSRSDDEILLRKETVLGTNRAGINEETNNALILRKDDTQHINLGDDISRRNSDGPVIMSRQIEGALLLTPDIPERSRSTPGSSHDTVYDHIVLLDKRVKTYMCKRCLETLKSEQEIRNHLFCKMLNNTVQCHVCRHLFTSEEYPEHLKLHAVNAKK